MTNPKLHHYVPRFYLSRFADASGRVWLWDRDSDRIFRTRPNNVAAEKNFYYVDDLAKNGHDPLTMERQLSEIEGQTAAITAQWLDWLREAAPGQRIDIPNVNRKIVSLYLALQSLRTADQRDIFVAFIEQTEKRKPLSEEERRGYHTTLLWDEDLVQSFAKRMRRSIWVFGRNRTKTPFVTSDNPLAFRTSDNAMWLKASLFHGGTYAVFPLAPDLVMYCYPKEHPWEKIDRFDATLSPVVFSDEMVQSENSAQVFMASRFVISARDNFDHEREFAKTIGTDQYANGWRALNQRKLKTRLKHKRE